MRRSARALRTLERTARGFPEVMVRVTGRQHGGGHVLANMSYISRLCHGEDKQIDLHTSEGEVLRDGHDMQELAQDWQEWETADEARRKGATSLSMILSMPAHTDLQGVKEAALAFAREAFANRSWVAALHVNCDHPHVHLTVSRRARFVSRAQCRRSTVAGPIVRVGCTTTAAPIPPKPRWRNDRRSCATRSSARSTSC